MKSTRRPREVAEWIENLAWLMDRSIKIGPWSIGLDGFLGLLPGIGDAAGGLVSSIIILAAIEAGIPRPTVFRMIANVATDSLLGAVPFLGDLFDFAYKANTKNVGIFREALLGERRTSRDWSFLILTAAVLLALISIPLIGITYLLSRFIQ